MRRGERTLSYLLKPIQDLLDGTSNDRDRLQQA